VARALGGSAFLATGAASGIGRALVEALAARGARGLDADVDFPALERAAAEDGWPAGILLQELDVRSAESWRRALAVQQEHFGRLDYCFNVAGVLRPGHTPDLEDRDIELQIDVNFKGVVYGTRAAARRMIAQGAGTAGRAGHIVNIASLAALAPIPGLTVYSATKYAVRAFSLAAAEELRPHGIALTVVCPDAVKTPMLDLQKGYDEAALTFTAPRFLGPAEVVELILGKVLEKRPLLVSLPKSRAFLARIADLFPALARPISGMLRKKGREVQARLRQP
jgi:NAD(P)-dependent dehydrogenase (short-subunit alcohol dehydrogenase family)